MVNKNETLSVYELAVKLVKDAFPERKLKVECEKKNTAIERTIVNIDKLLALGWKPETDVVEGFRRTVKSFEEKRKKYLHS